MIFAYIKTLDIVHKASPSVVAELLSEAVAVVIIVCL